MPLQGSNQRQTDIRDIQSSSCKEFLPIRVASMLGTCILGLTLYLGRVTQLTALTGLENEEETREIETGNQGGPRAEKHGPCWKVKTRGGQEG